MRYLKEIALWHLKSLPKHRLAAHAYKDVQTVMAYVQSYGQKTDKPEKEMSLRNTLQGFTKILHFIQGINQYSLNTSGRSLIEYDPNLPQEVGENIRIMKHLLAGKNLEGILSDKEYTLSMSSFSEHPLNVGENNIGLYLRFGPYTISVIDHTDQAKGVIIKKGEEEISNLSIYVPGAFEEWRLGDIIQLTKQIDDEKATLEARQLLGKLHILAKCFTTTNPSLYIKSALQAKETRQKQASDLLEKLFGPNSTLNFDKMMEKCNEQMRSIFQPYL